MGLLGGLLSTALVCNIALANPVPGLDTVARAPVQFPTPPNIDVWETTEGDFLVTFSWAPEHPVESPSVAGSFNNWSTGALPMDGPDGDGVYRASARMGEGEHQYKFVSAGEDWFEDPANPHRIPNDHGDHNSVLRLGVLALLDGRQAARGDGRIEMRAVTHRPDEHTYFDVYTEEDVLIRLRTLRDDVRHAKLALLGRDGTETILPMNHMAADHLFDFFEVHLHMPREEWGADTPVAYSFRLNDGAGPVEVPGRHPLVLDPASIVETPEWAKDAIWYQIMIDRFRDGDPTNNPEFTRGTGRSEVTHPWTSEWYTEQPYEREDGQTFWEYAMYDRLYGGDFQGVIDKLDYLEDLGVTALYFNPVFEATTAHKYNAKSFLHADDGYGVPGEFARSVEREDLLDPETWEWNASDELLLELVQEARGRGFRIIFDGVFNHLGDDAVPFLDVVEKGRDSRFADWYSIVSWEPFEYRGWAGFGGLPEFAKTDTTLASESLIEHIFEVTRRWMKPKGDPSLGIDGWRLDVPGEIPIPFWQEWRKVVKSINPDAYTVGEIWEPAEEWLDGTSFDAVMNYEFARAAFRFFGNVAHQTDAHEFDMELGRLRVRYPRNITYVLQNLYDSHDTDRWVSRLMNPDMPYNAMNRLQDTNPDYYDDPPDEEAFQKLKLMALFQATYPGAPMIYYGTEVGMFGASDPRNRMPMWWEDLMPYESPDYVIREDVRETFQDLFRLRQQERVLRRGDFLTLLAREGDDAYAFLRYEPGAPGAIAVVLNNRAEERMIEVPAPDQAVFPAGFRNAEVSYGEGAAEVQDGKLRVTLAPYSGMALRVGQNSSGR